MKAYRFSRVVGTDGFVHLSGLPPNKEVEIVTLEHNGHSHEMRERFKDIRERHPFARMTKEEILDLPPQTRETVWAEQYES